MPSTTPAQTLSRLRLIVGLEWMGATVALPLLPLYLERHGANPPMVGLVMASFFLAGVSTQYLFGHLADRFGRQRILILCLFLYALASFAFALDLPAAFYAISRAIQGAAAGAIEVTAMSSVVSRFPEAERGRAVSKIIGAQLGGVALGPLVGAFATPGTLRWAFVISGLLSMASAVTAFRTDLGVAGSTTEPLPKVTFSAGLRGAVAVALVIGICMGVYESCWSLLMNTRGASSLQIRLSWTLFATPFLLATPLGGWMADHLDRRRVALVGMLNACAFLAIYPHLHNITAMLLLGSCESIGAALTGPSTMSLLTQGAHDRELSRRQSIYTTANTAMIGLSAAVAGTLFTISPVVPFTTMAILGACGALSTVWWWRGVTGHIQPNL